MNQNRSHQSEEYLSHVDIHKQWESDYQNPDTDRFYDLAFDFVVKQLNVGPSAKILDAGCGNCDHALRLARGEGMITAVDFSDVALETTRQNVVEAGLDKKIYIMKTSLIDLPFDDNEFDCIVSWGVIMHIPEMERTLSDLVRILKPGGILVLAENNHRSLHVLVLEPLINIVKRLIGRDTPERRLTKRV